ncbi:hypothetical protein HanLR1_Chr14g0535721 [Helianthus annuus]|nr:hypothetical protein HanHA89_Chr14g0573311 [Helianthus annuus]KAJ0656428.1 hypothetical protein HanLR1_Chr14g0535721 [Helianthus annuus]
MVYNNARANANDEHIVYRDALQNLLERMRNCRWWSVKRRKQLFVCVVLDRDEEVWRRSCFRG